MNIFVGLVVLIGLILLIAFPERLLPVSGERKKRVGANYWGAYEGSVESENMPTIEAVVIKKKTHGIAGSTSYVMGRGTGSGGGSSE